MKLDINTVKQFCVCLLLKPEVMVSVGCLFDQRCGYPAEQLMLVYGICTKEAWTGLKEQITKQSHLHTQTQKERNRHALNALLLFLISILYLYSCLISVKGEKNKLKETQLAWDSLIDVCKCGQISPGVQHCRDLQPGKTPRPIN